MARIPYAGPPEPPHGDPDGLRLLFEQIAERRGLVLDLYRVIANSPRGLRAYLELSRHVRDTSSLNPRLRELSILMTGYSLDVEYEVLHHTRAARHAGVTKTQLSALPDWETAATGTFDELEQAVLRYAAEVARDRKVDSATFERLRATLTIEEVTDLVLTVAFYHMCAAIIMPLEIEPEDAVSVAR